MQFAAVPNLSQETLRHHHAQHQLRDACASAELTSHVPTFTQHYSFQLSRPNKTESNLKQVVGSFLRSWSILNVFHFAFLFFTFFKISKFSFSKFSHFYSFFILPEACQLLLTGRQNEISLLPMLGKYGHTRIMTDLSLSSLNRIFWSNRSSRSKLQSLPCTGHVRSGREMWFRLSCKCR